jgi:hypothetical protein
MAETVSAHSKPPAWQITVGAEGIAAAQFARCGFDVTVQSGRDKPWYDLMLAKAGNLLKVSVAGSDDGRWALIQTYLKRAADVSRRRTDFHQGIDQWLAHLGTRAMCCLVQFQGVGIHELPRIYVASPQEVANTLRDSVERLTSPLLHEQYEWTSGGGAVKIETLPVNWRFSQERIEELLMGQPVEALPYQTLPKALSTAPLWQITADSPRSSRTPATVSA